MMRKVITAFFHKENTRELKHSRTTTARMLRPVRIRSSIGHAAYFMSVVRGRWRTLPWFFSRRTCQLRVRLSWRKTYSRLTMCTFSKTCL